MTINHGFIWIMDLIEVVYRIDGLETLSPGWCRHGEAIHLVTETLERNVRGEEGGGQETIQPRCPLVSRASPLH